MIKQLTNNLPKASNKRNIYTTILVDLKSFLTCVVAAIFLRIGGQLFSIKPQYISQLIGIRGLNFLGRNCPFDSVCIPNFLDTIMLSSWRFITQKKCPSNGLFDGHITL
jgi:hypothetical protein